MASPFVWTSLKAAAVVGSALVALKVSGLS